MIPSLLSVCPIFFCLLSISNPLFRTNFFPPPFFISTSFPLSHQYTLKDCRKDCRTLCGSPSPHFVTFWNWQSFKHAHYMFVFSSSHHYSITLCVYKCKGAFLPCFWVCLLGTALNPLIFWHFQTVLNMKFVSSMPWPLFARTFSCFFSNPLSLPPSISSSLYPSFAPVCMYIPGILPIPGAVSWLARVPAVSRSNDIGVTHHHHAGPSPPGWPLLSFSECKCVCLWMPNRKTMLIWLHL